MRLLVTQADQPKHTELVSSVAWTPSNELFSCSDDKRILAWSIEGRMERQVAQELDQFATAFAWLHQKDNGFALACSDGTFRFMSAQTGRSDKTVKAHDGAVTALAWSHDGSVLVSAGEDGSVKEWSRTGNLRSCLAKSDAAVYSVCWSPNSDAVCFASSKFLTIKPTAAEKSTRWKAADATVLSVDWNPITGLIVSGAEDCRYKVWDQFGRQLFSSRAQEFPVTAVSWAPSGAYFAFGSFDVLGLCDRTGWQYSRQATQSGSLLDLAWTSDGTHVAAAGASGSVCFGTVVDRQLEWHNFQCCLNQNNQIVVTDVLNDGQVLETLEFGDPVVTMSLGFSHLIVATARQCYIYCVNNFNTPHIFDVHGTCSLIIQAQDFFLMVNNARGIQIFSNEGRVISNPKVKGVQAEFINLGNISLSSDAVAIVDRADSKLVHILDATSGRPMAEPIRHKEEIEFIALSQTGIANDRKLCIIDKNRDLFITPTMAPNLFKLRTMVDSVIWHDSSDTLACLADKKLAIFYYPHVVFVDRELLPLTILTKDASSYGRFPSLTSFSGTSVGVRRADGAHQTAHVSPFAFKLHQCQASHRWQEAAKLARFVNDPSIWATLSAMALAHNQLDVCELSLAAIDEVDKLMFIQYVRNLPSQPAQNAELALYRRQPKQAEQILIQAGLIFRAIDMNIRSHNWNRALELALKHTIHVDTVLGERQRYLASMNKPETSKLFLQYSKEVEVVWQNIAAKKQADLEQEYRDAGKQPPQSHEEKMRDNFGLQGGEYNPNQYPTTQHHQQAPSQAQISVEPQQYQGNFAGHAPSPITPQDQPHGQQFSLNQNNNNDFEQPPQSLRQDQFDQAEFDRADDIGEPDMMTFGENAADEPDWVDVQSPRDDGPGSQQQQQQDFAPF